MFQFRTLPEAKVINMSQAEIESLCCDIKEQICDTEIGLGKLSGSFERLSTAIANIRTYGVTDKTVVDVFNVGSSLESLCNCKIDELTADKALEALDAQKKSVVRRIIDGIKEFFRKLWLWLTNLVTSVDKAVEKIDTAMSLKDINEHEYKLIKQEAFAGYADIIKQLDDIAERVQKEVDDSESTAKQADAEADEYAKIRDEIYAARGDPDKLSAIHEKLKKLSEEHIARMDKIIQDCARFAEEGPGYDDEENINGVLTKLAEKYSKLLEWNAEKKELALQDDMVATGTCSELGYTNLIVIKQAANVYKQHKNEWKQKANSWVDRLTAKYERWLQRSIKYTDITDEKMKKAVVGLAKAEIARIKVVIFLQKFQVKVKAEMASTLKTLANRCVAEKIG